MLKQFLIVFVVGLPFAILYSALEYYLPGTWWPAGIVITLMLLGRVGLYLYRRSKGIHDTWLDS
ncbi:hypothetical protein RRX38_15420 [Pseudomonas sp. DTU_2021_1001937_2_SI_NGA_ILE_001]|uniref:hypothetical protein n=1 Tax=Pseudomonas sp. DTU_2021_1001937_2_SI_NGA_ILE_001 TaxID=3077589 RepID=UPI0028FC15F2|nr:hypothetical protein [Pseudomonas sp. DTU_2021_1001937_2_SI_NGA_ILE_001]WNW12474.1 hypothetical protein RRX38_15420 [Pseudomonas sp. DTU_2021_1001937_2_SI_NGA_ILE_001]